MIKKLAKVGVLGIAYACMLSSHATASEGDRSRTNFRTTKFAKELGATLPPQGWVDFCNREPEECTTAPGRQVRVKLDKNRWRELKQTNAFVNRVIEPATDQELYQKPELWTYPEARGDCEDYVLLKRLHLISLGWPREALLITVVLDKDKSGHAVLTVVTDSGEFILDNQHSAILPWTATGYQFVKRQAQTHPSMWVALDPLATGRLRFASSKARVDGGR